MAERKLNMFHRGFTYSREEGQWQNGDFAIFIPSVRDEYEYPAETKYAGKAWIATWDGVAIAACGSVNEAILHLEDAGWLPAFDEGSESESDLLQMPLMDRSDVAPEVDHPNARYVTGIFAYCRRTTCNGLRETNGYITSPKTRGWKPGHGDQFQIKGVCVGGCGRPLHATIQTRYVTLIPDSVKLAAIKLAGKE